MRTKPWSIRILAFLFILGPFFNALAETLILNISLQRYFTLFFSRATPWELFAGLCLYPIAGIAIYAVKPWSYPIYLAVTAVSTYSNFHVWQTFPNYFSLPVMLTLTAVDLGLVSYFLIPAVRSTYFDKKLRWWESRPRYIVNARGLLHTGGHEMKCTIANISEGGAFIKSAKKLDLHQEMRLHFSLFDRELTLRGKIVYRRWRGLRGYGLEFVHTPESHHQLTLVVKDLRRQGAKTVMQTPEWKTGLEEWAVTLFKTGKGLVPELPQAAAPKPLRAAAHKRTVARRKSHSKARAA